MQKIRVWKALNAVAHCHGAKTTTFFRNSSDKIERQVRIIDTPTSLATSPTVNRRRRRIQFCFEQEYRLFLMLMDAQDR